MEKFRSQFRLELLICFNFDQTFKQFYKCVQEIISCAKLNEIYTYKTKRINNRSSYI